MWLCKWLNAHCCTCFILIWEPDLNTQQMVFISCDKDNGNVAMTCPKTHVQCCYNEWLNTYYCYSLAHSHVSIVMCYMIFVHAPSHLHLGNGAHFWVIILLRYNIVFKVGILMTMTIAALMIFKTSCCTWITIHLTTDTTALKFFKLW